MKKRVVAGIAVLLLILAAGGGFFWWKLHNNATYAYDEQAKNGIIEARSKEEIKKILNQQVEKGTFNVSMNPNPIFKNGSSEGELWIENIPNNSADIKVVITLKNKDKQKVFETKKIRPNQNIKTARLNVNLPKGEYPAVAHFTASDKTSGKLVGAADMNIKLSIMN